MSTRWTLSWLVLCSIGMTGAAHAQGRADCRSQRPPSIGVVVGRSLPYLELASDVVPDETGSVSVRGGTQTAGRAELPLSGPFHLRLEAATARWDVRRQSHDPEASRVAGDRSIGSMSARHLVALVGLGAGQMPACAHVSAGGGFYSIGFGEASLRRAGFALAAGMEAPTGRHGVIQADATLHVIRIGDGSPITNFSDALTLSLLVGWAYRF